DGGGTTASDTLSITASTATVSYGTDPSSGVVSSLSGDVSFAGIEVISLTGDGDGSLTVNGTNGNDAITQNNNTITVNNGAVVNFTDYPTLTLNGNNGNDAFNVKPTTLVGVTTFLVNGNAGDATNPTGNDRLTVNGT